MKYIRVILVCLSVSFVSCALAQPRNHVQLVQRFEPLCLSWSIVKQGDYVYYADVSDRGGIRIAHINSTTPPTLTSVGHCPISCVSLKDFVVSGNYAYVVADSCLWVVNVAIPDTPVVIATCRTHYHIGLAKYEDYIVATDGGHVTTIDVSDPYHPSVTGDIWINTNIRRFQCIQSVAVTGHYAYVSLIDSGLYVVNIDTPAHPSLVAHITSHGNSRGITIQGSYAFWGDSSRLRIFDVSNPAQPQSVGTCLMPQNVYGLAVEGNIALVGDFFGDFRVVNISNPAVPVEIGYYGLPAYGIVISSGYAFVTDLDFMYVYDYTEALSATGPSSESLPTHFSLAAPYPNPFNASTLIKFELPLASRVKVQVFDGLGRMVNTLSDESMNAGTHQLQWNGAKESSGQYYVLMSVSNGFIETKQITLVK